MRTWREVPKNTMLVSLLCPFSSSRLLYFTRGCDAELCSLFLHHFKHSFRLLSADFLFAWKLIKAPKNCYVDQEADDFDILIQK